MSTAPRPPITADEVYVAVLDLVHGEGLSPAEAVRRVAATMDVSPEGVRDTVRAMTRRYGAEDLLSL